MAEQVIDYRVKQASIYKKSQQYGLKQISHINQKSKDFKFFSEQDHFQFQIQFKVPAIITTIQIKAKQTNQVSFDLYNNGNKICNVQCLFQSNELGVMKAKSLKLEQKAGKYDRVVVDFFNHDKPKQTCINYIFFKGFKQANDKKSASKVKNVSQNDTFEPASKKKIGQQQKKVFNTRNKQRTTPIPKTMPKDLLQEAVHRDFSSKDANMDSDIQRAIQLSKKEYNKQQKMKQNKDQLSKYQYNNKDSKTNNQKVKINVIQEDQYQYIDYQLVQYEKIKKTFEHVTQQWIQAQRKAEKRKNVSYKNSLADKIKIKIFKQLTFCLNNIPPKQKTNLTQTIKELGGRIVQQPQENGVVITSRMEGGKVNFAKQLNKVFYVKPEYVYESAQIKERLEFKGYQP